MLRTNKDRLDLVGLRNIAAPVIALGEKKSGWFIETINGYCTRIPGVEGFRSEKVIYLDGQLYRIFWTRVGELSGELELSIDIGSGYQGIEVEMQSNQNQREIAIYVPSLRATGGVIPWNERGQIIGGARTSCGAFGYVLSRCTKCGAEMYFLGYPQLGLKIYVACSQCGTFYFLEVYMEDVLRETLMYDDNVRDIIGKEIRMARIEEPYMGFSRARTLTSQSNELKILNS